MQLNRPRIRHGLALATCALLQGGVHAEEGDWKTSSSFLFYSEKDRVSALEPAFFAAQELWGGETLGVRVLYDALTGASPSGASVSDISQTISGTTTAANTLPVEKFSDSRVALGIDWTTHPSSIATRSFSFNLSKENDYTSVGGSGSWTRDYNRKLTTLAFSIGAAYDTIQPRGSIPTGLQSINATQAKSGAQTLTGVSGTTTTTTTANGTATGGSTSGLGSGNTCTNCRNKTSRDVMVGITQVLSRRTLLQLNYSVNMLGGYLTDPYKVLSIVDAGTGSTVDHVFENRPSKRLANSLYTKLVHNFDEDVVHLSYRYFSDDWGVRAHTTELQYRLRLTDWLYLEPQLRYHQQTKASFFHHSIANNVDLTALGHASADLRLADMIVRSAGIKMGIILDDKTELSARFVKMTETGINHPADAVGVQKNLDMYPMLEADIFNFSYSIPL